MKRYDVNLNGQAQMRPNWKADAEASEFDGCFAYCLDAPAMLPAGSTFFMFRDETMIANMSTIVHRERQ